jgi:hypothetical protein
MLAVKPPFSRTPMIISDAQTMNSDIPATIMDVLNISYPFKGDSIFKIDPAENRQRLFVTGKKEKYLVEGSLF